MTALLIFAAVIAAGLAVVVLVELLTEPPAPPEPFTPLADLLHTPRHAAPRTGMEVQ